MTLESRQIAHCTLYRGDVLEVVHALEAESIDAIVTDPPYGLEFMGQEWDGANGFRRSLNAADVGRDNVFGRTSRVAPEYRTVGVGQKSMPGIGPRETAWPSHQGWNQYRCATCGHLFHGGSPCQCSDPQPVRADNRWQLFQRWCASWAQECLRVLKPGGHLLAFGGSRTYHRLACAIEDAGFEIRDQIMWLYGSGFPKNLDVAKAIDAAAGIEREVIGTVDPRSMYDGCERTSPAINTLWRQREGREDRADLSQKKVSLPASETAQRWDGWGTALKPAHEPIVVARKPLRRNVTENISRYGVGALHIAACRIPGPEPHHNYGRTSGEKSFVGQSEDPSITPPAGRWPANVIHDGSTEVLEAFAQYGDRSSARANGNPNNPQHQDIPGQLMNWGGKRMTHDFRDSGSAARFFYTAKVSPSERAEGLPRGMRNDHPTVKPVALMRYLVQLVTPAGGCVLDPFMGSGTTGCACAILGHRFIGIEREQPFFDLAGQRIMAASAQLDLFHHP